MLTKGQDIRGPADAILYTKQVHDTSKDWPAYP